MGLADQFKEKAEQLQNMAKGKKDDSSKSSGHRDDRTQEMKDKAENTAEDRTDKKH